jgi:hypothetical protein
MVHFSTVDSKELKQQYTPPTDRQSGALEGYLETSTTLYQGCSWRDANAFATASASA